MRKEGVDLLVNKPGLCFKEAWQCRSSNYLYAVVEAGYIAQRWCHGFNSHPGNPGVAQLVRAQHKHGFDSRSAEGG